MGKVLVGVNIDEYLGQTEKAIHLMVGGKAVWIAKSQIYNIEDVLKVSRDRDEYGVIGQDFFMEIPPWLAKKLRL